MTSDDKDGAPRPPASAARACDACLRRTDLIVAISGSIDIAWREKRGRTARVLALPDEELLALGSCQAEAAYARFDARAARHRAEHAGVSVVCGCDDAYPQRVRELADPPAVLHVAGTLPEEQDAVAIVGARRATAYGLEVAQALGRGLSRAGVPVVSGLALGVDSASHAGALEGPSGVVAVLACGADVPYPPSKRALYARVVERGCVVSELPPGFGPMRWCFVARNRIIAALARVTIVVEAAKRSGSLTTADFAAELGRTVGAVPGRITCAQAAGTNGLIQSGAPPVLGVQDVLDLLADATGRQLAPPPEPLPPPLEPHLAAILEAVEQGRGAVGDLAATQEEARAVLAALSELEFKGLIRRDFGGRYERAL
jgi:DNA processing protein